ncbi:MAG TPA: hypothetical protein VH142_19515 [Polyangiaceae bacterium]|jgi:hypothetical protein|nr:hypothetical protein [Polyangiaceae bacterium]
MEIVYAAYTQSGVFMLDADGICRWAVGHSGRAPLGNGAERVPERIVGAQYLAALDVTAEGGLVDLPRVGCPMLFAATDPVTGRVRLVRTPPLLRFEDRRNAPTRRPPLASKFDFEEQPAPSRAMRPAYEDEKTPARPSSIPPPFSEAEPIHLTRPITVSGIVPAPPGFQRHTPLPPPPRARIAARIPPAPSTIPSLASATASLRDTQGVTAIPVRTRAANMTLKKLARGK